ncbi:hypothetical protein LINPERPRIM_LOCUS20946 [Linum perenne]
MIQITNVQPSVGPGRYSTITFQWLDGRQVSTKRNPSDLSIRGFVYQSSQYTISIAWRSLILGTVSGGLSSLTWLRQRRHMFVTLEYV